MKYIRVDKDNSGGEWTMRGNLNDGCINTGAQIK